MKNPKELGNKIKEHRKKLKITQKDLALTANTGVRFVIELEQGKSTCQIGKVMAVLNTLGLKWELNHG